ncbi:DUF5682 family protein [Streptomyces sp. NPDC047017]|uniref:DUF5682 family protein n=1 Tax=Streptomyces sp. NPDC047017 TaxID=3155024 RepID=UPI00340C52FC
MSGVEGTGGRGPGAGPLLLGVRHHGPGSARAVRAALEAARPRVVLIEGPPEADALIPLAADEDMRPPVALLAHAVDEPGRSAFWPLAGFSPEWVAIRWALEHRVPARFIDLPATHTLAWDRDGTGTPMDDGDSPARTGDAGGPAGTDGRARDGRSAEEGTAERPGGVSPSGGGLSDGGPADDRPADDRPSGGRSSGGLPEAAGRSGRSGTSGAAGPAASDGPAAPGDPEGAASGGSQAAAPGGLGDAVPADPEDAASGGLGDAVPGGSEDAASGGLGDAVPGGSEDVAPGGLGDAVPGGSEDAASGGLGDAVPGGSEDAASGGLGDAVPAGPEDAALGGPEDVAPGGSEVAASGGSRDVASDDPQDATLGGQEDAAPGGDVRVDPLAALAGAAGYDDPERWWEDVVEHRGVGEKDVFAPFLVLEEAMGALREAYPGDERDLVREAHMRLQVRAAQREFGDGVAVVCGAWHVPALRRKATVAADRALLKGLPKVKADMTWVPWTHRRLSRGSGYGAGIDAPGWYAHLFDVPDRPVERWLTKVAGLLRAEDRIVSSAHVIEAVRLAGTLAAMRGRPLPGLGETTDAVRAVMCDGSDVPLALVHDRLVVGDVLGEVPEAAPAVPLQRDLTRLQRRLRLKPEALERELELDLRKETDAARSRLLHRLRLLGVCWGEPAASRGSTGTFRETWRLRWEPELSVRVAEAGVWGTTVLAAATARAEADATAAQALAEVTALAERCLLAELPGALPVVMRVLADRAALDTDVGHLAQALPSLVRSLRYGDVRGTGTGALAEVAAGLAERVFVGLPPACAALDAEAAEQMRRHVDAAHTAVGLLGDTLTAGHGDLRDRWHGVLRVLSGRDTVPGVLRGRAVRLLLDDGRIEPDRAARLMGLALSPGTPPPDAAAWIEGFVGGGGGMLLVHDERLLALVDTWLTGVPAEAFTDVLPLLRRTFSAYEQGVRRTLGELVRRGPGQGGGPAGAAVAGAPGFGAALDEERADAVLPVVRLLLGVDEAGVPGTPAGDELAGVAG